MNSTSSVNTRIRHSSTTFLMFANQLKYSGFYDFIKHESGHIFCIQAPMAVIGLTCRMDAISLFEKRVRSRFSHRQIYLLAKPNFENFVENFKGFLQLEVSPNLKPIYVRTWNKSIDDLVEDAGLEATLKKLFYLNSRYRTLQNILVSNGKI